MLRKELFRDIKYLVGDELGAANRKFPLFASNHEGYAVIKEEIEEAIEESNEVVDNFEVLWGVIRENGVGLESVGYIKEHAIKAAAEFIQVAAMCDKYLMSEDRR